MEGNKSTRGASLGFGEVEESFRKLVKEHELQQQQLVHKQPKAPQQLTQEGDRGYDGDKWLFVALKQDGENKDEFDRVLREEFMAVCRVVRPENFRDQQFSSNMDSAAFDAFKEEARSVGIHFKDQTTWDLFIKIGNYEQYAAIVFAGHATKKGIKFGSESSPDLPVVASLLAEIENLRLLILNCCSTEELGKEVLKKRSQQQFYIKDKHDIVVFCWSTECQFDGARYMNEFFCREVYNKLSSNLNSEKNYFLTKNYFSQQEKAIAFRSAFQSAIERMSTSVEDPSKLLVTGYENMHASSDKYVLGEPMLLPYLSSDDSYLYGMVAKYKAADTAIELMKRLKSIVNLGFLVKEKHQTSACGRGLQPCDVKDCQSFHAKVTTMYQIGEFFGWLQLMRDEDPLYYRNKYVLKVIYAFSREYEHLRDDFCKSDNSLTLLMEDPKGYIGDFAKTVKPGCFTLDRMDIKAIAEVMRNPENPRSVRSYIDFYNLWTTPQDTPDQERAKQVKCLRLAFAKLAADIEILAFNNTDYDDPADLVQPSRLGSLYDKIWSYMPGTRRLPLRAHLSKPSPIYTMGFPHMHMRRDSNVYRRIGYIHDSLLLLVSILDPSIHRTISQDTLFYTFTELDAKLHPTFMERRMLQLKNTKNQLTKFLKEQLQTWTPKLTVLNTINPARVLSSIFPPMKDCAASFQSLITKPALLDAYLTLSIFVGMSGVASAFLFYLKKPSIQSRGI